MVCQRRSHHKKFVSKVEVLEWEQSNSQYPLRERASQKRWSETSAISCACQGLHDWSVDIPFTLSLPSRGTIRHSAWNGRGHKKREDRDIMPVGRTSYRIAQPLYLADVHVHLVHAACTARECELGCRVLVLFCCTPRLFWPDDAENCECRAMRAVPWRPRRKPSTRTFCGSGEQRDQRASNGECICKS